MTTERSETPPLFTDPTPGDGDVTKAVRLQIGKLRDLGFIEDHHAGLAALAIMTAQDIDRSRNHGAPSGRANLYRVMNEVLESLPHPEAASNDQLQSVLDVLRDSTEDDVLIELEAAPRP